MHGDAFLCLILALSPDIEKMSGRPAFSNRRDAMLHCIAKMLRRASCPTWLYGCFSGSGNLRFSTPTKKQIKFVHNRNIVSRHLATIHVLLPSAFCFICIRSIMDVPLNNAANDGSSSGSGGSTSAVAPPNSTELMIALSQIQQLIPLLEYRPGGLTHLLPTLLTPLLPLQETVPGESMQRYRANVDHAFRVAAELVGRVQDGASVGSALELAERLMQGGDEKARILRVRKKRRLFVEQEKVLEVNSWGPPVPPARSAASAKNPPQPAHKSEEAKEEQVEVSAFLPSQNPPETILAPSQANLGPPTTAQAVQSYLAALHTYLKTTVDKGLFPPTIQLKQIKARIVAFGPEGFTLELRIARLMKAFVEASMIYAPTSASEPTEQQGELQSVDLTALTIGGLDEAITSTTPSRFPIFQSLSSDVLTQTHRATSFSPAPNVWTAYTPITETIARLILAAASFQA